MLSIKKFLRIAMAVMGGFLIFAGVGTSDYYTIELGQAEPQSVWHMIVIGALLMLPSLIHAIRAENKRERANNVHR